MPKLIDKREHVEGVRLDPIKSEIINNIFEKNNYETVIPTADPYKIQMIPISQLMGAEQNNFISHNDKAYTLSWSIANFGIIEIPHVFIVRDKEKNDKGIYYEIIAGNTRFKAYRLAWEMARKRDPEFVEHIRITKDDINKGITTVDQKIDHIVKTFVRFPAIVHDETNEYKEATHKITNIDARSMEVIEFIINAPAMETPEEQMEGMIYLYGKEKVEEMKARGLQMTMSNSEHAKYICKFYLQEHAKELSESSVRVYLRAWKNACDELKDAVMNGTIKLSEFRDVISNFDHTKQRELIDCYGTDEYERMKQDFKNKKGSESNDSPTDPYKVLAKTVKQYASTMNDEISQLEREFKKQKASANTMAVVKQIKKINKLIIELETMKQK